MSSDFTISISTNFGFNDLFLKKLFGREGGNSNPAPKLELKDIYDALHDALHNDDEDDDTIAAT